MADSNQNYIPSADDRALPDGPLAHTQPGLSVSRRVKIGIVLLAMLCGYFLMDDRPHPDSVPTDVLDTSTSSNSKMQGFINDLNFVAADASSVQTQPSVEPTMIRLPVAPAHEDIANAAPGIPGSHQAQPFTTRSGASVSTGIANGTVVKFTGHIEPLH